MDYPREFSLAARARIEAERIKALRELDEARRMRPDGWTVRTWDKLAFDVYIMRVFQAFGLGSLSLGSYRHLGSGPSQV